MEIHLSSEQKEPVPKALLTEFQIFPAIVRVKQPNFVPEGIHVRQRANDYIFLGEFKDMEALNKAREIDDVLSIEITKRLRS